MVPKLIGTKELETPTIHRTNSTYICAYRYENEFHAHLIQIETRWSFPYILSQRKKSMPNEIHEVNMHAQDFQNPKPKKKKNAKRKGYQMEKSSLETYH